MTVKLEKENQNSQEKPEAIDLMFKNPAKINLRKSTYTINQ